MGEAEQVQEVQEQYGFNKDKLGDLMTIISDYTTFINMESQPLSICHKVIDDTDGVFSNLEKVWVGQSFEAFKAMFNGTAQKFCNKIETDGIVANRKLLGIVADLEQELKSIVPKD